MYHIYFPIGRSVVALIFHYYRQSCKIEIFRGIGVTVYTGKVIKVWLLCQGTCLFKMHIDAAKVIVSASVPVYTFINSIRECIFSLPCRGIFNLVHFCWSDGCKVVYLFYCIPLPKGKVNIFPIFIGFLLSFLFSWLHVYILYPYFFQLVNCSYCFLITLYTLDSFFLSMLDVLQIFPSKLFFVFNFI